MADKPKKKVTIVAKKKKAPTAAAPPAAAAAEPAPPDDRPSAKTGGASGERKKDDKGLLDLQRWLDFPAGVAENARDVWMAGIGALSSVEEAGQALFDELVRKGERWERESRDKLMGAKKQAETAAGAARSAAQDLSRQPGRLAAGAEAQIQRLVEDSVEGVLHRMGVPTHEEVRSLIRRVESLSGKVDQLMTQLERQEVEVLEVPPPSAGETHFRVAPGAAGWVVEEEGASRASSEHPTKASAVAAGRELARREAPSTLVVLRQDGTEQGRYSYEAS